MKFEVEIIKFLQSGRNGFFDVAFQVITYLGSIYAVLLVFCLLFIFKRKSSFWFAVAIAAVQGVVYLTKILVHRVRPYEAFAGEVVLIGPKEGDFCFPSGHSATIMLIAIFVGYLLCCKFKNKWARFGIIACCAVTVGLVVLSRLYLGVHYLTDTLAGVSISAVLTAGVIVLMRIYQKKKEKKNENKNGD